MALLIDQQITLTQKNDAGPFFDVYYSPDCITYYASPNGQSVYLPSVGSSVVVQIASTTQCIKLVSIGQCTNEVIVTGSIPTTTSTTQAPTTTVSPTTLGPTTTTEPPFLVYRAIRVTSGTPISVTYTDPYNQERTKTWSSGAPLYYVAKNNITSSNATVTALGSSVEPFYVYDTGSVITNDGYITNASVPNAFNWVHGYYLDYNTKTAEYFEIVSGVAGFSDCVISGSLMLPANSLTGLSVAYSQGASCSQTTTTQAPTTSTTTLTPTTTAAPTTTVPQYTSVWSDAQPGGGNLGPCECDSITAYEYQIGGGFVDIYSDLTGKTLYEDWSTNTKFLGDDRWYCLATGSGELPEINVLVGNDGIIDDWLDCRTYTTTTQSPTTTPAPATLEVDGRTLVTSFVALKYTVNQGTEQTLYEQTLGISCTDLGTITGLIDGDIVEIYEDTSDYIEGAVGAGTCPSTVGTSTSYQVIVGPGSNAVSVTVNTGAVAPTTSTTLSPTTTLQPYTDIYSDSQPGSGNLGFCECDFVTAYNYQVLGNQVDITQDMTGKTIYEDWTTSTLFVGDEQWYCIATSNGVTPTINIQINNLGEIMDWIDCSTITTTTQAPTTTSTTTQAGGCYEYTISCPLGNPLGCNVQYTDCTGTLQSFTQPEDTDGVICAQPTPTVTGGTATFEGPCPLTTTTQAPTTTQSPTTTTTAGLTEWQGAGPYGTSTQACDSGSVVIPDFYDHNGSGTYPTLDDYVYDTISGNPLADGFYYVSFEDTTIEVETGGRVIDKIQCGGGPQ